MNGKSMKRFRVIIPYREFEFEKRIGRENGKPFTIAFQVEAETSEQAKLVALDEFKARTIDSQVGWNRTALEDAVVVEELAP